MQRPDRSHILIKEYISCLFIVGKKDNYIDFETLIPKIKLNKNSELLILENSGHMGFVEEADKVKASILKFYKKIKLKNP